MVSLSSQRSFRATDALAPTQSHPGPSPAASRRHARFVRAMKLVLPAIALALVALVLAWPGTFERIAPLELPVSKLNKAPTDTMTMSKPRYIGTDGKGRPFMITADTASQDPAEEKSVTLTRLQADMTMKDGSWFTLMADTGNYRQQAKMLELGGKVDVFSDQGYEFHATDVTVDLDAGRAVTEKPVQGHGPFGALSAKRMEISENGNRYRFDGGVHVRVYPGREN
jgi:lipopolysaccharide export system protein LptC